ncbi:MAG TPA: hypothetical protein VK206_24275 [Anaerolineales bacterium]|nr:hypothetical protein [Anaerolineales bacterium]HLO28390.1 hypothetical protein [Anaerolineales bacterium]
MRFKRSIYFIPLGISILLLTTFGGLNTPSPSTFVSQPGSLLNDQPFYLGMLEDSNLLGGNTEEFRAMIGDLQSRGLDTVMFSNNDSQQDEPLLNISDELNFNVFMIPTADLNINWWPSEVPANLETALTVADPIVNRWKSHPSLKGYLTKDEPGIDELEKVSLIGEAFRMLDPSRPVMPILIGVNRVAPIFNASQPEVMLIDVYPFGAQNDLCDLAMTGFGYPDLDFVDYVSTVTKDKPASVPLWIILQTHNFLDQLREPIATEVREEQWLAIGEGAKSIFWFTYSSQQGWRGLRDNPELYAEVTSLTQRILPLRDTLLGLQKTDDLFTISGTGNYEPYASTLSSADNRHFVVAVNKDCQSDQQLTIQAPGLEGQLRDLETDTIYNLDSPISFLPGDGKIFELIPGGEETPTDQHPMGVPTPHVHSPHRLTPFMRTYLQAYLEWLRQMIAKR